MNRGQEYARRKKYIEEGVGGLLAVKEDFLGIKYARHTLTDSEYVRIADVQGRAITLNITALNLEEILEDIARVVLINKERIAPPAGVVTDPAELRTISALFNRREI